ncbi:MAG TPA: LemA family protein [Alphaproteobacteria bacterium]|nr:LemA family protein [Alphaproteobacteria bacterium]
MWLWVVIGLAVVFVLVIIWIFNKFVRLRAMSREGWSGIDVQLKRRYDLVPNLVETVKGYKIYEKDVLTRIVKLRGEAGRESHPEARGAIEGDLAQTIGRLFAVAEKYPDLKASKVYLDLQEKLTEVEDHLQYARRYYNGTVRNLNIYVQSFPSNLIAAVFGFKRAEYFQLDAPEEGLAPEVKLAS